MHANIQLKSNLAPVFGSARRGSTIRRLAVICGAAIVALAVAAAPDPGSAQQASSTGLKVTPITKTTTNTWGKSFNFPIKSPEVTVGIIEYPPGTVGATHVNPFPRYVYVLEGALTVDTAEGKSVDFPAGSIILTGQQTVTPKNKGSVPVKLLVIDQTEAGVANSVAVK